MHVAIHEQTDNPMASMARPTTRRKNYYAAFEFFGEHARRWQYLSVDAVSQFAMRYPGPDSAMRKISSRRDYEQRTIIMQVEFTRQRYLSVVFQHTEQQAIRRGIVHASFPIFEMYSPLAEASSSWEQPIAVSISDFDFVVQRILLDLLRSATDEIAARKEVHRNEQFSNWDWQECGGDAVLESSWPVRINLQRQLPQPFTSQDAQTLAVAIKTDSMIRLRFVSDIDQHGLHISSRDKRAKLDLRLPFADAAQTVRCEFTMEGPGDIWLEQEVCTLLNGLLESQLFVKQKKRGLIARWFGG